MSSLQTTNTIYILSQPRIVESEIGCCVPDNGNVMDEDDDVDGGVGRRGLAIEDHEPIDPQLATRIGQIREPFSDNKDVLGSGYASLYM